MNTSAPPHSPSTAGILCPSASGVCLATFEIGTHRDARSPVDLPALAQVVALCEGYWVNRVALAAFASGLAGALLGATFGAWAVRNEPCVDSARGGEAKDDAGLARRVEALERALASVEPPVRVLPTLAANDPNAAALDGADLVGAGPVLEATVVDLVGKPPSARDGSRPAERELAEGDRYWAQELTMQLGLTPAQTERSRAIRVDLDRQLARAESGAPEKRSAARRALQQAAEQQLRSLLAPRQLAAYEALDARLKLYPAAAN